MAAERPRGALVVGLAAFVAFLFVAWQVAGGGALTGLDHEALAWMVAHRTEAMTRFMHAVSDAHETVPVLVAAVLIAATQWPRHRAQAGLVLILVFGGRLLNIALKHVFERGRPESEDALVHLATYSFPSGHTAGATVLYAAVCAVVFARTRSHMARVAALVGGALMVLVVAVSRVYLGAHYVSDTLAAFFSACAWVCAVWWVLAPTLRRQASP